MNEELGQPESEAKVEGPVIEPDVMLPAPKKSKKNLWIIAGAAVLVICIGSVACLALFVAGVGKVTSEIAPVETVLDAFMKNMQAKDIESAYAYFSPRFQGKYPMSVMKKALEDNNYAAYDGYQSLSVSNINLTAGANTDSGSQLGTIARVSGDISYSGGFTGHFQATLERVDGNWMISGFNITFPPDKLQP